MFTFRAKAKFLPVSLFVYSGLRFWLSACADWFKFNCWQAKFSVGSCGKRPPYRNMHAGPSARRFAPGFLRFAGAEFAMLHQEPGANRGQENLQLVDLRYGYCSCGSTLIIIYLPNAPLPKTNRCTTPTPNEIYRDYNTCVHEGTNSRKIS